MKAMANASYEPHAAESYDVFISYSHQDESDFAYASQLANALTETGYSVWWDRSLLIGEDWDHVITRKMKYARRIVALISKCYLGRENCLYEIRFARGDQKLLPLMLEQIDDHDLPGELAKLLPSVNRVSFHATDALDQIRRVLDLEPSRQPISPDYLTTLLAEERIDLPAALTCGAGFLAGRDYEEKLLLDAWTTCDPAMQAARKTNVVVLHAIGGAGKTALIRRLVDRLAHTNFSNAQKSVGMVSVFARFW